MQKDTKIAAANIGRTDLKKWNCEGLSISPQDKDGQGIETYRHIKRGETLIASRRFLLHGIGT